MNKQMYVCGLCICVQADFHVCAFPCNANLTSILNFRRKYAHAHEKTHTQKHTRTHTLTHTHTHTLSLTHTHTHTHTHKHTQMRARTYTHTRIYRHACTYTHTCTKTHTQTHTFGERTGICKRRLGFSKTKNWPEICVYRRSISFALSLLLSLVSLTLSKRERICKRCLGFSNLCMCVFHKNVQRVCVYF